MRGEVTIAALLSMGGDLASLLELRP